MKKNIIETFLSNAKKTPKKTAVIFNDKTHTYEELENDVRNLSGYLEEKGIEKDTHVIVMLPNSYEFIVTMLSIANIGAVMAPINITLKIDAIQKAIQTTHSKFILSEESILNKLKLSKIESVKICSFDATTYDYRFNKNNVPTNQDYILALTSGSTGDPKPIVFTQETKINRALLAARDLYQLSDNEKIIVASPLYHSMGQRLILLPLLIGGVCVLLEKFTPKAWLESVSKYNITFTIAIASHLNILVKLIDDTHDLTSLRTIVSSSSLLEDDVKQECIKKFKCDFHECYGASEVGIITNLSPFDCENKLSSVGTALPFLDMKIVNEKREEVKPYQIGEIITKSKTAFSRYYNNEEKTNESVVDGYFYTADLGMVDEEGYLYLKGRKKDLIIVGGTNVYPVDIENIISQVAGVKECSVVGITDSYFGEIILAAIVKENDDFNLRDVKIACINNLAEYQQPMAYEILETLPKNDLGKIMKHKLQVQFKDYDASRHLRKILK